jgi:hypothetical protein
MDTGSREENASGQKLVHRETAARLSETSNQRMKLIQFGLQMLVHQQKRFKRSPDVAITSCDDFVDGELGSLGTHCDTLPLKTRGKYPFAIGAEFRT